MRRWRDYSGQYAFATGVDHELPGTDLGIVERIARALERLGPREPETPDFGAADAFVWQAEHDAFLPVAKSTACRFALLKGVDRMRDTLLANTQRFARGLPANNALLWGARGMGKSSLVKAVHGEVAGA